MASADTVTVLKMHSGAGASAGSPSAPLSERGLPPGETHAPVRSDLLARAVVIGLWAVMATFLFWDVCAFARDVPWMDEWELVPVLSGHEPLRLGWFWEQHNEHRIALPKLVHVAVGALTGADLRAVCYLDVLALSAAAGILIVAARRLRGHTILADAFIPLILLHEGQSPNIYSSFQVQFVLSTVILLTIVSLFVTLRNDSIGGRLLTAAVLALFLPLCGANGIAVVPPLCLLFLWVALFRGSTPTGKCRYGRPLLLLLVFVAIGITGLALFGLDQPPANSSTVPVSFRLRVGFEVLTMLGGAVGSVPLFQYAALGTLLVVLVGLALLARSSVVRADARIRAAGLLACGAGVVTLALTIGWGRAGIVESDPTTITYTTRYVTLIAPLACCGYFAWELRGNRLLQYLLCFLALVLLPMNKMIGTVQGTSHAKLLDRVAADARMGIGGEQLAEKYWREIYPVDRSRLSARFEMLRDARIGPYRSLPRPAPSGSE